MVNVLATNQHATYIRKCSTKHSTHTYATDFQVSSTVLYLPIAMLWLDDCAVRNISNLVKQCGIDIRCEIFFYPRSESPAKCQAARKISADIKAELETCNTVNDVKYLVCYLAKEIFHFFLVWLQSNQTQIKHLGYSTRFKGRVSDF